jgi:hypothetical protein
MDKDMKFYLWAERAIGGLYKMPTGLSYIEIKKRDGDWLTFEEAVDRGISFNEAAKCLSPTGFAKHAIQFSVRDDSDVVHYLIGAI